MIYITIYHITKLSVICFICCDFSAFSFCSLLTQSQMMFLMKHRKLNTPIHQLLEIGLRPPIILAGLVRPLVALISHPQEALPNQQHLGFLRLGRLPQVPFNPAQEPRASFPDSLLPQVDTLQDQAYLDSSPPTWSSGQFPSNPGAPGQFPSNPGAPGQFPSMPGQFPPGGAPMTYPVPGQYPSPPGAPQGPYPNVPYPAGPSVPGMYGPGGPGAFPPDGGPGYGGGMFPPVPPGSWGSSRRGLPSSTWPTRRFRSRAHGTIWRACSSRWNAGEQ